MLQPLNTIVSGYIVAVFSMPTNRPYTFNTCNWPGIYTATHDNCSNIDIMGSCGYLQSKGIAISYNFDLIILKVIKVGCNS